MRAKMWSHLLVTLSVFSSPVWASSPTAPEPGTRVTVRLTEANGQLPDAEKMVEAVEAVGGEHRVRVMRRQTPGQAEMTLDLWGNTVPQADIPNTLRTAFPVLTSADIQVSSLDPKDLPKLEGPGSEVQESPDGKVRVKKVVKIIKKE